MTLPMTSRVSLGIAGLSAVAIGLAITIVPQAFYASYGIALSPQPNLMSELRAPGANLAAQGMLILAGALFKRFAHSAALLGATVFFAFATGRVVSILLDGWPAGSVLAAFLIEVFLGGMCLLVARQLSQKEKVAGTAGLAV